MLFSSKRSKMLGAGALAAAALTLTFGTARRATSSDHAGTVQTVAKPGTDLSDLHIFPNPNNPNNVVLSMSVRPLIPAGQSANFSFDEDVLYQFKIDTTGDNVEDLVIQARFEGTGANQRVFISGPVKPSRLGTTTVFERPYGVRGRLGVPFTPSPGIQVFAGAREDPFFIDLEQLFAILPDRGAPIDPKLAQPLAEANTPRQTSFRAPGQAVDFLANFNVLAIVVELPKSALGGGQIRVWETTSVATRR